MRFLLLCGTLAALAACAPKTADEAPNNLEPAGALGTSLEAEVAAGTVQFVLHVTNSSNQPIRLEFPSAQRYDFVVATEGGAEVWRWSADQMFAQVIGEETLQPNQTRDFTATWNAGTREGSFVVTGRLTANNMAVDQSAEFEIRKR